MRTCFQRHRLLLLFLFLSEIFSSVGGSSVQEVIGAVGESVTFTTSVPVSGNLIYKGDTVGQVLNKHTDTNISEKFMNRLDWVSQSGFFTLSDLRTDDSGLYTVESIKEPKGRQNYQLEVYERVSAPQVKNTTYNSSELCSLLCSVRNVRGLKLDLYEDDVLLNHTSSSSTSDTTLNLHLEIKKMDDHRWRTFSCVASNRVSTEKTTIDITHYCSLNPGLNTGDEYRKTKMIIPIVLCLVFVLAVVVTFVYLRKRKRESRRRTEDSSATEGLNEEVQYSVINHKKPTQANIRERVPEEACPLTTIYDQIRPERSEYSNSGPE